MYINGALIAMGPFMGSVTVSLKTKSRPVNWGMEKNNGLRKYADSYLEKWGIVGSNQPQFRGLGCTLPQGWGASGRLRLERHKHQPAKPPPSVDSRNTIKGNLIQPTSSPLNTTVSVWSALSGIKLESIACLKQPSRLLYKVTSLTSLYIK